MGERGKDPDGGRPAAGRLSGASSPINPGDRCHSCWPGGSGAPATSCSADKQPRGPGAGAQRLPGGVSRRLLPGGGSRRRWTRPARSRPRRAADNAPVPRPPGCHRNRDGVGRDPAAPLSSPLPEALVGGRRPSPAPRPPLARRPRASGRLIPRTAPRPGALEATTAQAEDRHKEAARGAARWAQASPRVPATAGAARAGRPSPEARRPVPIPVPHLCRSPARPPRALPARDFLGRRAEVPPAPPPFHFPAARGEPGRAGQGGPCPCPCPALSAPPWPSPGPGARPGPAVSGTPCGGAPTRGGSARLRGCRGPGPSPPRDSWRPFRVLAPAGGRTEALPARSPLAGWEPAPQGPFVLEVGLTQQQHARRPEPALKKAALASRSFFLLPLLKGQNPENSIRLSENGDRLC